MHRVLLLGLVAACTISRAPRPPEAIPVLPETPPAARSWLAQALDLRTQLGRAGIGLQLGGAERELVAGCGPARRCLRCELVGEHDRVPDAAFEEVVAAFARYPTALLEAAQIEQVALCRRLVTNGEAVAGLADQDARRLYVSLEPLLAVSATFSTDVLLETVHHEVYHLLDFAQAPTRRVDDPEWNGVNASGFVYGPRAEDWTRPFGFVNAYAATNAVEDRASVFQFLMAKPQELCELVEGDPIVAAKARLVWQRLGAVTPLDFVRPTVGCAALLEPRG